MSPATKRKQCGYPPRHQVLPTFNLSILSLNDACKCVTIGDDGGGEVSGTVYILEISCYDTLRTL
jgi:hypothetical protein